MGFLVKAVKSVVKAVVGVAAKVVGAVFGFSTGKKTVAKTKSANNLNKSLDPEAYRKIVLGAPALPLDVRFWEVWGANGANFDEALALAGHRINAIKEIYFEDALGFDAAGNPQGKYIGVVSRAVNLGGVGQAALAVGSQTQWTAAATFDGCPHIKLAWVPDEKKLPNGIPSRYTIVGEGALVYDPRRDSTRGGSGTHRADDRSTWSYATLDANGVPIGRNNALQALWYLLGWTVQTKDAQGNVTGTTLTCGRGVDPQDINMATFIAGANACEVAGYYTDVVLSTEDTHTANEDKITCDGLIGRLLDPGGLWSYYANVNDTSNIAVELTDADILQGTNVTWNEYKPMSEQYNQVSGKYVNPSATTLYQAFPYPLVRDATYEGNLGIKRRKPQDFEQVLDAQLAQRLARLLLNEGQYQGEYSAGFNYRALKAQAWSVVRYTSERFGWVKLFRVYRYDLSTDAGIGMLLREIDPSIWSAGTVNPPVAPGVGNKYNPNMQVAVSGLAIAQYTVYGPGASPSIADGANVSWNAPPINVRRTELRYRVVGTSYWETVAPILRGTATNVIIFPLVSGAQYEVQIRHITIHEIEGDWLAVNPNFTVGTQGNITYAGIVDASGKAIWSNVTGSGKPENNADVTGTHISSGITSQGTGATANNLTQMNASEGTKLTSVSTGAGSTLSLIAFVSANIKVEGNTITKVAGGEAWDGNGSGYSPNRYVGSCMISARRTVISSYGHAMFGLAARTDPTAANVNPALLSPTSYAAIDYAIHFGTDATTYIFKAGGQVFAVANASINDVWALSYEGRKISFTRNGVELWSEITTAGRSFYPAFDLYYLGSGVRDLMFSPFAQVARLGSNTYGSDGITLFNQADLRTSEGIAGGIVNQGTGATANNLTQLSPTEGSKLGTVASGAGSALHLVVTSYAGGVTGSIVGNGVSKTSGGGSFNFFAYSLEMFKDSAAVYGKLTGTGTFIGLTTAKSVPQVSADSTYGILLFSFHRSTNGNWYIFESGGNALNLGTVYNGVTFTSNTNFIIIHDGRYCYYYADGVLMRRVGGSTLGQLLRIGLSIEPNSAGVTDIQFSGYANINLYRDDGTTAMNQAEVRTAEGVASGFYGQGSLSTLNSLAYGGSYLTGFGGLAGKNYVRMGGPTADYAGIYNEGGSAFITDSAYKTSLGVASGFTGQTAFATLPYGTSLDNGVFGMPARMAPWPSNSAYLQANAIAYDAGYTVQQYKPEDFSSNRTENRIASGFTGQGYMATQNYADWSTRVTGTGKPSNNAGTSLRIYDYAGGRYIIYGNTVVKTGTTDWDYNAYSYDFAIGTAYITGVFDSADAFLGLTTNRGGANFGSINYSVHRSSNGNWYIYEGGAGYNMGTGFTANTQWLIVYNGYNVTYYADGLAIRSVGAAGNLTMFAAIAGYLIGATVSNIVFGPYSDIARSQKFDINGRVTDPRAYNTQFILGPNSTTNLSPSYTVNSSNVTVSLPSHTRTIAGPSGPIALSYGAMSAVWPFSSYWAAYVDDLNLTGLASPAVVLTSNPDDLLYPGRYQVASGVTPSSGGTGGGTGGGGGGGGGFENCVAADSFMPDGRYAMDYKAGDALKVLCERTWSCGVASQVMSNKVVEAECAEIVTKSGIRLIASVTTPCTLRGGAVVNILDVLGLELAVEDAEGFRWERVIGVSHVGIRAVAHISANNGTYAAGAQPERYIYTHNIYYKP